jgi:hypothetical protein
MDKLTSMVSQAADGATGGKLAEMAGGDPGESLEQTGKEKMMENVLHDKVQQYAGAQAADSAQAKEGYKKIADAVGDKIPTSMLGAGAMAGLGGSGQGNPTEPAAGGNDAVSGLMNQAQGFLGKK